MGVLKICKKLRYGLNPYKTQYTFLSTVSNATNCRISSTGYSLFHQNFNPESSSSYLTSIISNGSNSNSQAAKNLLGFLRYNFSFKMFYSSCINSSAKTISKLINTKLSIGDINCIIDIIRGDGIDMEFRLNSIGLNQMKLILDVLCWLNILEVPVLRFFTWLKDAHPSYCRNANICSLVVANFGFLGDYAAMLKLLEDFRNQQICLSEKAFGFLPISSTSVENAKKSITEVVEILNEVGGSCRNSGIHSLVEMLCSLNEFDLAKYVIKITEEKVLYYNVLVKHMCSRGQFKDAWNLFEEMRQLRCDPDCRTYNYAISSLCKQGNIDEAFFVLQDMLSRNCSPNLISFEILIHFACRYGRSDQAVMFYDLMVSSNVKPYLSTHYAFIRGYFRSQQFEKAHRYVIRTAAEDKCSHCWAPEIYNVLASLHLKDGDLLFAYRLLVEMLGKGLKPKHSVFMRVNKCLHQTGHAKFADSLKALYDSRVVG
ncbi:pentatricopeptide repeat-containing protein At3g53700, chloroplastic-like [Chenopodium quinoa]|uniref:pentatricopeptide repeat-containing protein At3g53700, chloroplastic-like n=1 Tax=Chenopodium quinoa TaxID=63459 RepID=UPI000B797AF5|nr:pentatricopeptide repeat-containing protein At3g53700, chloroplastic-like [Chenopodium quinoa]